MTTTRLAGLTVLIGMVAACSAGVGSNSVATHAPPSPSPTPTAATGSFGVLVSPPIGYYYTVSVVDIHGQVVASQRAEAPLPVSCGTLTSALLPPPVNASDGRVYFLDNNVVRYLTVSGESGQAARLPWGGTAFDRWMFAVSSGDRQIAVVHASFKSSGNADFALFVLDLAAVDPADLAAMKGALITMRDVPYTLWPIGWHGEGNLVVAKVPACTHTGGPFCCGPQELYVLDPKTADRRFTVAGPTCRLAGPPSTFGAVCEDAATFQQATVVSWTGQTQRTLQITAAAPAYLSPAGRIALEPGPDTAIQGTTIVFLGFKACQWIDDSHLLAGGDAQHPPRVADTVSGSMIQVSAQGDCAGRLPGGL